jgi:hypothetical protein
MIGIAAFIIVLLPSARDAWANAQAHMLPDQRNALATWAAQSIEVGGVVSRTDNHKTLSREWGGFQGAQSFPLIENATLSARSIEEWRALGATYAIVPDEDYQTWLASTPAPQWVADTLLIKRFAPDTATRGPSMVVLRLTPMQHTVDVPALGGLRVMGYDMSEARAGEPTVLRLYWQAENATADDYHVFVHVLDSEGALVAQADGTPLADPARGTSTWHDANEVLISQPFTVDMAGLADGRYTIVSGFYHPTRNERLTADDGRNSVLVTAYVRG